MRITGFHAAEESLRSFTLLYMSRVFGEVAGVAKRMALFSGNEYRILQTGYMKCTADVRDAAEGEME